MRLPQTVCVLAALGAVALSFAPYVDAAAGNRPLRDFATDQPPAFWFGQAAVVLLVLVAAVSFRSLRVASRCAVVAVVAAAIPAVIPASRGGLIQGWVSFTPTPPRQPDIDAASMWGLGGLLAVAACAAAVLILARMRASDQHRPGRTVAIGLLTLAAVAAALAVATSSASGPNMGMPRRYADYLPVSSGSTFGGPTVSVTNAWLAAASVALVLVAAAVTRLRRPFTSSRRRRSS